MADVKLFEVTLKYFICAETQDSAVEEMLKISGDDYASMDIKELQLGFIKVASEPKADLAIEPEVGKDEIPF